MPHWSMPESSIVVRIPRLQSPTREDVVRSLHAIVRQCVIHIHDGDDSRGKGNLASRNTAGISGLGCAKVSIA